MFTRKGAVIAAACAFVIGGSAARAAEPAASTKDLFTQQPAMLDDAPANNSAINMGLDKVGAGSMMKQYGLKVSGFIEGSYTYNLDGNPPGDVNAGRVFDFENNAARMNQLELFIQRNVDVAAAAKAGKWDVGFGVEMMYGSDARLIHANGLSGYNHFTHPINQFDLTQAYVDVVAPIGNGLDIRAGKFVTLLGYETINPTSNPFYSHSYSFGFGIPFTETGITGSYALSDKLSVTAGITRGWDQATNDNNGAIDFLGQIKWVCNPDLTFYLNSTIGPERTKNNSDYRYVFNPIAVYAPAKSNWSFAADGIYAWEEHASLSNGKTAYWYGVTGYVGYKLNDMITLNGRAEWFRDDGGSRTGIDANLYEFTVGAKITPFTKDKWLANLTIRPEFRYDLSNKDAFDGGNKKHQETVAIDAIFAL